MTKLTQKQEIEYLNTLQFNKYTLFDLSESSGPDHYSIVKWGPIAYLKCDLKTAQLIVDALNNQ